MANITPSPSYKQSNFQIYYQPEGGSDICRLRNSCMTMKDPQLVRDSGRLVARFAPAISPRQVNSGSQFHWGGASTIEYVQGFATHDMQEVSRPSHFIFSSASWEKKFEFPYFMHRHRPPMISAIRRMDPVRRLRDLGARFGFSVIISRI